MKIIQTKQPVSCLYQAHTDWTGNTFWIPDQQLQVLTLRIFVCMWHWRLGFLRVGPDITTMEHQSLSKLASKQGLRNGIRM